MADGTIVALVGERMEALRERVFSWALGKWAITRTLEAARPWLFLWRLALSVTLIGFWPVFCQNLALRRHWTEDQLQRLLAARWTVAAWLVVLELLLGQNVVGKFIHLWA